MKTILGSLLGLATLAMVLALGCDARDEQQPTGGEVTELTEPRQALSEELMVALAQAKNFHHKADVYLRDAHLDRAIEAVEQILAIRFPEGSPEAEDVILDARARLAKLLVTRGDIDRAMKIADEGITSAERQSFFLANLHTVRGEAWEARALQAAEAGEEEVAKRARIEAIKSFDRSIRINESLLEELVKEPAP